MVKTPPSIRISSIELRLKRQNAKKYGNSKSTRTPNTTETVNNLPPIVEIPLNEITIQISKEEPQSKMSSARTASSVPLSTTNGAASATREYAPDDVPVWLIILRWILGLHAILAIFYLYFVYPNCDPSVVVTKSFLCGEKPYPYSANLQWLGITSNLLGLGALYFCNIWACLYYSFSYTLFTSTLARDQPFHRPPGHLLFRFHYLYLYSATFNIIIILYLYAIYEMRINKYKREEQEARKAATAANMAG